jgi:hypothetical protein
MIRRALEAASVEFIDENGAGADGQARRRGFGSCVELIEENAHGSDVWLGVRFRKSRKRKKPPHALPEVLRASIRNAKPFPRTYSIIGQRVSVFSASHVLIRD